MTMSDRLLTLGLHHMSRYKPAVICAENITTSFSNGISLDCSIDIVVHAIQEQHQTKPAREIIIKKLLPNIGCILLDHIICTLIPCINNFIFPFMCALLGNSSGNTELCN